MRYFNLLHIHLQHLYIGTNYKCQYYWAFRHRLFYFASMKGKFGQHQECNCNIKRSLENVQCGRRTKRCHCWIFHPSTHRKQWQWLDASRPPFSTHLYPKARFHHKELVHQFFVKGSHILRYKLLVHGQAKFQNLCLEKEKPASEAMSQGGLLWTIHYCRPAPSDEEEQLQLLGWGNRIQKCPTCSK